MKKSLLLSTILAMSVVAQAQFASDNASNAPYVVGSEYIQVGTTPGDQSAALNGMNGGYGWEKWQRGGYGSTTNHGSTMITDVAASFGMGAQQFGMRSAPDGSEGADARRRLVNDLNPGHTMSFSMMAGGNGAGAQNTDGGFGFDIRSSFLSGPRDIFGIYGEDGGNWLLYDLNGDHVTSVAVTPGQRLDVSILTTALGEYDVTLTPFGGSSSTYQTTSYNAGQKIRTVQFYVFGTDGDFYVNNLEAVPEPGTMIALGLGALALVARRRKA